jgi:flagellar FliL protein
MAVEKAPLAEETVGETKKKSPVKLIILVVGTFVLIGVGAAVAKILLGGGAAEGHGEVSTGEIAVGQLPTFGHIISLEPFTVNLDEGAGSRYLRVKINLELERESLEEEITARMPVIRDVILLLLSGLTYDEIRGPDAKQALKIDIQERIDGIMQANVVRRILFEDFLVQ